MAKLHSTDNLPFAMISPHSVEATVVYQQAHLPVLQNRAGDINALSWR